MIKRRGMRLEVAAVTQPLMEEGEVRGESSGRKLDGNEADSNESHF